MEELEEDEDVVIEGSDLHKALLDMGYTDFESTSIGENKDSKDSSIQDSRKRIEKFHNFCGFFGPLTRILTAPKSGCVSIEQLATILKVESLLDDHAASVLSILERNSRSFWRKVGDWSPLITSVAFLGFSYLLPERRKTLPTILASAMTTIALCRKYEESRSVKCLREVAQSQNELYYLYKKSLRILRKGYQLRSDAKQSQSKFSNLEIDRLAYLQPLTEALLKSMENVSHVYYGASTLLLKLLPSSAHFSNNLTKFEVDSFAATGEITYSTLRHLYYVYILTQSDTMQLLAFAHDRETWTEDDEIPYSHLNCIISELGQTLKRHKMRLAGIVEKYENCKTRPIQRKYRGPAISKWRDLYLNLDLLSRKVQTAYDAIGTILEEIEKRENSTSTDEDFAAALNPRINDVYKQIDVARNFAEFNNLLLAMMQRSRRRDEDSIAEEPAFGAEIESDSPIVRDSDPQIIDEVFEEYITEEYLKPIYDENDEAGMESAKLDKLLAKNFMSELKEALIDKYKSMSEREAKALLRKYRETDGSKNLQNETKIAVKQSSEISNVPAPPPLPGKSSVDQIRPQIVAETMQRKKFRSPVPLPRRSARSRYCESSSPESETERFSIPPPPSIPAQIDVPSMPERFSIDLPKQKMPAFVTFEEEFIGSGENSAEESENSECEEDRGFVEEQRSINESTTTK